MTAASGWWFGISNGQMELMSTEWKKEIFANGKKVTSINLIAKFAADQGMAALALM